MKTNWLNRFIAAPGPHLCLCLSEEEYDRAMKHLRCKHYGPWMTSARANATTHLMVNNDGSEAAVVCLRDHASRDPVSVAALLVHEAVHVWQWWAESHGETKPGAEQEAYAIQYVSQVLMEEFSRRMKDEQRQSVTRKRRVSRPSRSRT